MSDTPKSTAVMTTTPLRQVKDVKELLFNENAKAQLQMVTAQHLNPERMMRVVANAIRTTPKLQACEPMSFLGALMHCASLGLEPNTPLGHAYLIPFENKKKGIAEIQVVIGYKGFIDLARRSGKLANIHADVVYSDDVLFTHEYGSNQHIRHIPGPRKGKITHFYCFVEVDMGDGATAKGHRVMSYDEIITHRNTHSQGWKMAVKFGSQKNSPWFEGSPTFEAMGAKTVVRMMAGRGELPMSVEFMNALESDERKTDFRGFAMEPVEGLNFVEEDEDQDAGNVIEGEAQKEEAKSEPDPQQEKAKPEPDRTEEPKKTPVAATKADDAEIAERRAHLVETILKDLVQAGKGHTRSVMEMYTDQLDMIEQVDPDAMERINKRAFSVESGEYENTAEEGAGK